MSWKNYVLTLICLLLVSLSVSAQENKPQIKLGGTFYLHTYYDTYKSVDNREGLLYSYPKAPQLDENGKDINKAGQFGMSVYQTRFNIQASDFELLDANANVLVEVDFLGSKSDNLQMIRLRHAYLNLNWDKNELLFGQTWNLEMPEEVISGVLTSAAGSPISVLSRPIMIRYGHRLGEYWKTYAAISYHRVQAGDADNLVTYEAARNNGFPSIEARLQYKNERLFFGFAGSYKSLRPRLETEDGFKTTERIGSANVTAFLNYQFNRGGRLKTQAIYGSNLTNLGMPGGYGKRLNDSDKDNFSYTNLTGFSVWADLESKSYNNFYFGIFGGYFENRGTGKSVDPQALYARDPKLKQTGRISPRAVYAVNNLTLGAEYSLYFARWGKEFNDKYRPKESHDMAYNHRISLLVAYKF